MFTLVTARQKTRVVVTSFYKEKRTTSSQNYYSFVTTESIIMKMHKQEVSLIFKQCCSCKHGNHMRYIINHGTEKAINININVCIRGTIKKFVDNFNNLQTI